MSSSVKETTMADMDEEVQTLFPPLGRHAFLDAIAVRRLVEAVQPGLKCQGNVERSQNNTWRLRVTLALVNGKRFRRGITLPDDETTTWVREYIEKAKRQRRLKSAESSIQSCSNTCSDDDQRGS